MKTTTKIMRCMVIKSLADARQLIQQRLKVLNWSAYKLIQEMKRRKCTASESVIYGLLSDDGHNRQSNKINLTTLSEIAAAIGLEVRIDKQ